MLKKTLLVIFFLLLGAVSGYVSYKVILLGRTADVPDLKGQPAAQAAAKLKDAGLKLRIEGKDFDPVVPDGGVMGQDPQAGEKARLGSAVKVVISKGPATSRMPLITGQPIDTVKALLARGGLVISKVINAHSGTVPEGTIIGQDPAPDEKTGQPISVVVSAGPYDVSYYCPDFRLMRAAEASALANSLGVEPVFESAGDMVVGQKPKAGSKLEKGQTVYLQLAQ
ncbi:MAG: PASTA domain-containing protein [Nitrospiraceae bacterium]|nr:PASTA domain-containing protein [Nitrospiraceae bacterium]